MFPPRTAHPHLLVATLRGPSPPGLRAPLRDLAPWHPLPLQTLSGVFRGVLPLPLWLVSTGPRASEAFPTPRRAGCAPAGHQQLASAWFPRPRGPARGPPRPRSCWLSPRAQHGARHTAENHQCDLSAQRRPDPSWCNCGRRDPTRKRSGFLHSWHWDGRGPTTRQPAWGPGAPLPPGRGHPPPAPQPP